MKPVCHNLQARGERAYVWSRGLGNRVIVVIDDAYMHVGVPDPFPAESMDAHGLYAIFRHAADLPDTRAIGFFELPSSVELIDNRLCPELRSWLAEVATEGARPYFLIDVYFGPRAAREFELGFPVFDRLKIAYPDAKFAFLSTAGAGKIEQLTLPGNTQTFAKYTIELEAHDHSRLPHGILHWMDAIEGGHSASWWELREWQEVRQKARQECESLGQNTVEHGLWAHHLPYGGSRWPSELNERISDWTIVLRNHLSKILPVIGVFPDHEWEKSDRDKIASWERPPIRALAQSTEDGKDVSTALYLVSRDVLQLLSDSGILFASSLMRQPDLLTKDYLWFNVSAICKGLYVLATSFRDEFIKARSGESKTNLLTVPCHGGVLFWEIMEASTGSPLGIRFRVHQSLVGWSVGTDDRLPCLLTKRYRFPEPAKAIKAVRDAYDCFIRSGATITVDSTGALELELRAKNVDGFWEFLD